MSGALIPKGASYSAGPTLVDMGLIANGGGHSWNSGQRASTGGQAGALRLGACLNFIDGVQGPGSGVMLPNLTGGQLIYIFNRSTSDITVWVAINTADTIVGVGASETLPAGTTKTYVSIADGWVEWIATGGSSTGPFLPLSGGVVNGPLYATDFSEVTTTPFGNPTKMFSIYQHADTATGLQNFMSGIDGVTGTSSSDLNYNQFYVLTDNSSAPSNTLLNLSYHFGGPNFTGTPCAFTIGFSMDAASPQPPSQYQMAANIYATMKASAGGTNTGAGASGNLYGLNITPELSTGATNWMEITSAEIDSAVATGASVSRRVNLKLCLQSNHAVQGAYQDVMLEFGRIYGATVGALKAIVLGGMEGLFPLDNTNGVFISHEYAGNAIAGVNPQVSNFIDATHIRALNTYWASPGAVLDSQGGWQVGPSRLGWWAGGTSLDVHGQTGGTPAIVAGGSGAITGQIVTTGHGDLYTVTASGGAITALTPIVAATSQTTGPTTPQSIRGDGTVGATCTIPWTNAQTLALQPSGGAITAPLLTNAANDAAAASAGVVVGQLYRNGSVVMQRVA